VHSLNFQLHTYFNTLLFRLITLINLSIRGLAKSTTEESLTRVFSEFGVVRSLKLVNDLYTGECRGFASISMEGHEARGAMSALNNTMLDGSLIRVSQERDSKKRRKRHY
jgi:RNA recognition motif-containing protein